MKPSLMQGQSLYAKLKREVAETVLSQSFNLLGHSSEKNYRRLIGALSKVAKTEHQKMIADWIQNWVSEGNPGAAFLTRIFRQIHPNVRRNYLAQMIANLFFRDQEVYERLRREHGLNPPSIMLISPTMRCNYRCNGCYAHNYNMDEDMPPEVLDRVLNEAEALGTRFFIILGGEPFLYPSLFDIFKKHSGSCFQVYTNGSLIDKDMAARLVELGNVSPQVSLEGFREQTDPWRGKGAFDRAMRAMDNLREAGCIFAFSTVVSPHNIDTVTSDEFIDLMIEKGALYGWYFLYMPVSGEPDLSLMPTPEQRNKLRVELTRFRKTKPILFVDFWNDGVLTAGCINGGRIYLHINHRGDVEPCIFCHYATHNINQTSLVEALKSPFFKALRSRMPYDYNTLLPCPIIDHPEIMRSAIKESGAYPTHEGAEKTYTELTDEIDKYAAEVQALFNPIWEQEYLPWADKWMQVMDHPPEQVQTRKEAYYENKEKLPEEAPTTEKSQEETHITEKSPEEAPVIK
jgi:MoaA/NifB/PqqE/SkfB family radical SAM enzyme